MGKVLYGGLAKLGAGAFPTVDFSYLECGDVAMDV